MTNALLGRAPFVLSMLSALALAPAALAQSDAPAQPSAAAASAEQSGAPSSQSAAAAAASEAPAGVTKAVNDIARPPAGKAEVIFYRPAAYAGWALSFSVHEGQTGVGKLGNGSYFVYIGDPGEHTFSIQSEATDTLHMELDPDEIYYVKQTIGMGIMMGRPHLTPSDEGSFQLKPLKLSTKKPSDLDPPASHSGK